MRLFIADDNIPFRTQLASIIAGLDGIIACFAKRQIVFRDGKIKSDKISGGPRIASEVLKEMPQVDEEEVVAA